MPARRGVDPLGHGTRKLPIGTVWIQVKDTVPNGASLDKLHVDYLAIKTTP